MSLLLLALLAVRTLLLIALGLPVCSHIQLLL
jgi:hypothetical protein